jgi:Amt family ammonium transporter
MRYRRLLPLALILATLMAVGTAWSQTTESGTTETTTESTEAAPAAAAPAIDTGDTAWMLVSTALVMLMTPGLALFYGGMVRRKNVLATIMQSFIMMGIIGLQWILWGFSLAFGPDVGGIIGGLDWIGLRGIDPNGAVDYAPTIPAYVFMAFQMMFAVITPALITGAFAERMKFSAFIVFSILWATLVYDPLAHWVWGRGWIMSMGALDFAGGLVVHMSSGVSALAAALLLGKRRGQAMPMLTPHNLPFTVLGASLLWFGWFGFNAGSALTSNTLAGIAFVVTNTATAAAAFTWILLEWRLKGNPTVLGAATGAVAGLVAITPASGFVGPMSAIAIGVVVALVCYFAIDTIKARFGYDDTLDAFGVHGVGGAWGALATGLFASTVINPAGRDGLFFGNPGQLGLQAVSVLATLVYSFVVTLILLKIVDIVIGLRVSADDEVKGLDITQHHESGYTILD